MTDAALPETIGGKYRVIKKLGQGGMGSVYEAEDPEGRRVAVKTLISDLAKNATHMGRFEREAKAAAAIDTEHIVRVLDAGTDEATGLPYMAMERLEGEDLSQLIKRTGPLPPDVALRIGAQACMALQKAHDARIIHRDIKPANLFLAKREGGERILKLLDFGIAKVKPDPTHTKPETAGLTRTGTLLGSPLYMSPEQARGNRGVDHRSDIWSLGIVLYQAMCGKTPLQDTGELGELIIMICTEAAEPLQDVAPWVPLEVAILVHRALRLDPVERFRTAGEMQAAIEKLLPWGSGISESMLRGVSDADRSKTAERVAQSLSDTPPPRRRPEAPVATFATTAKSGQNTLPPTRREGGGAAGAPPLVNGTISASAVGATTAPTNATAPANRRLPVIVAIAGLVAVGLVVVIGVAETRGDRQTPAPPIPASTPSKPRSVKLVVLPSTAAVEIDGAPAKAEDGLVEITGELGSVHKVRLSAGGADKRADVVVTENGASPPKLEVAVPASATTSATSAAPIESAAPRTHPTSKPPPTTTATTPVLREDR